MRNIAKLKPFDKVEIVRKSTRFSIIQKLILLTICTHLGEQDFCYLSLSTLQEECCISKRSALVENLKCLIKSRVLWKISPTGKYKSNRYGIDLNLLVTNGHHTSDLRLPVRSPSVTSAVTNGHPKEPLNKIKKQERGALLQKSENKKAKERALKAIKEIKKSCRLQ